MDGPGHDASTRLPDGRTLEYWEGGDPDGRGVVYQAGTPVTRTFGRLGHEAAVASGVRLVAVNRPGYGGSAMPTTGPSLFRTGEDTAFLAASLGMAEYAVLGASGGGPFAVATAIAAREAVHAVGVAAGIAPWRLLAEPSNDSGELEERALLAMLDAGDLEGARAGYLQFAQRELGGLVGLDADSRVDTFLAWAPRPLVDRFSRSVWADNLAVVLERLDGYVLDNLAWGGDWDVDLHDVRAPTALWYGADDPLCPPAHGQWYAERIEGAELIILPGEGHLEVCSDHWAEQLNGLISRWA